MTATHRKGIVFYTESPTTGGVSVVMGEIAAAASSEYDCTVVCPDDQALRAWGDTLRARNVAVAHVALKNKAEVFGWLELPRLARIYRTFHKSNVVHFHLHTTFSCLPAIFIAKFIARKRVVTTEHYISQLRFIRNKRLPFPLALLRESMIISKLALKRLSLMCVDQIVTVSDANRLFFLSIFGRKYGDKVTSIANGVDVARFATAATPSPNETEFQIVTTIAGLNNQKGHEYLIRAIPLIKRNCPQARFVFAGDGHLRNYLQRFAQDERVSDAITFAGHVEDVRSLLSRTSLVVLPSLFEGMPISILEAMAAGKAVVATNVDGTAEVVVDGVTGFLVPPKDPEQLAQKTVELLKDRAQREMFGRNGELRVRNLFSLERMVGPYLELFRKMLSDVISPSRQPL